MEVKKAKVEEQVQVTTQVKQKLPDSWRLQATIDLHENRLDGMPHTATGKRLLAENLKRRAEKPNLTVHNAEIKALRQIEKHFKEPASNWAETAVKVRLSGFECKTFNMMLHVCEYKHEDRVEAARILLEQLPISVSPSVSDALLRQKYANKRAGKFVRDGKTRKSSDGKLNVKYLTKQQLVDELISYNCGEGFESMKKAELVKLVKAERAKRVAEPEQDTPKTDNAQAEPAKYSDKWGEILMNTYARKCKEVAEQTPEVWNVTTGDNVFESARKMAGYLLKQKASNGFRKALNKKVSSTEEQEFTEETTILALMYSSNTMKLKNVMETVKREVERVTEELWVDAGDGKKWRDTRGADNGYDGRSNYADTILKSAPQSMYAFGIDWIVDEIIQGSKDTVRTGNDMDDVICDATVEIITCLNAVSGDIGGCCWIIAKKVVDNIVSKHFIRKYKTVYVSTDEQGNPLLPDQLRKITYDITPINTKGRSDADKAWWLSQFNMSPDDTPVWLSQGDMKINGNSIIEANVASSVREQVNREWYKGFMAYAKSMLNPKERACVTTMIQLKDRKWTETGKDGVKRSHVGASLEDINKAVYNGDARNSTVSKLRSRVWEKMSKLRREFDRLPQVEEKPVETWKFAGLADRAWYMERLVTKKIAQTNEEFASLLEERRKTRLAINLEMLNGYRVVRERNVSQVVYRPKREGSDRQKKYTEQTICVKELVPRTTPQNLVDKLADLNDQIYAIINDTPASIVTSDDAWKNVTVRNKVVRNPEEVTVQPVDTVVRKLNREMFGTGVSTLVKALTRLEGLRRRMEKQIAENEFTFEREFVISRYEEVMADIEKYATAYNNIKFGEPTVSDKMAMIDADVNQKVFEKNELKHVEEGDKQENNPEITIRTMKKYLI